MPHKISTTPVVFSGLNRFGKVFSINTSKVKDATQAMLITPTTNSTNIKAQQQPVQ